MRQYYRPGQIGWSFEIFPPKTEAAQAALFETSRQLARYNPVFLSITYGAGGSTRSQSLDIARKLIQDVKPPVTAHFTCVGSNIDDIRQWLADARDAKVSNIMALRGDPPQGQTQFQQTANGFRYASELVKFIKTEFPQFGIGVAGYPETHAEASSADSDLDNLKRKIDLGGDVIYTQLFYDNDDFFRFRDKCQMRGIDAPLVPGLLPVLSLKQVQRITALCKAKLPQKLVTDLQRYEDDPAGQVAVGIAHCTRQLEGLLLAGVPGIHFYVLNRIDSVRQILINIGKHPVI
ncbi:MAG: methylenetetrahydrofolate reductase [NAD(P)H] [Planctomycetia bacterium]|nr:methylenetetrahydrofolate reductase [NAD(P)H] [Planctomycetia bacterium]